MKFWHFFSGAALFAGLNIVGLSACITPPTRETAMVLPPAELRLISTIKRGKDYANSGRPDLAELDFRRAIAMRGDLPQLYNDLGFVLQAQQRLEEAEDMYAKAIQLDDKSLASRENLARLLYQRGDYVAAIEQYHQVLDLFYRAKFTSADAASEGQSLGGNPAAAAAVDAALGGAAARDSNAFDESDEVQVLRNISISYYSLGLYDEAICYSWLAHIRGVNLYQAGQHSRLLFALERPAAALAILRGAVIARQGNVTAEFLLDYGLALYLTGEFNLAKAAFNKVLATNSADLIDRRTARFLRILLAEREQGEEEVTLLVDTMFEEEPDLCSQQIIDPDNYWPLALRDEVSSMVELRLCNEN